MRLECVNYEVERQRHKKQVNYTQEGKGSVGIRVADSAGNCHSVEVRSSSPGSNYDLDAFVDG